jgi:hypothetical protein
VLNKTYSLRPHVYLVGLHIYIFIDVSKHEVYSIFPLFNGLADHDAQLIVLNNIKLNIKNMRQKKKKSSYYFRVSVSSEF